ncbi:tautomerase PptA [Fulvimarina endophytica]|uniref:Tautomerase PptA n=1 Tax=Fulvimarina endophytica TaxID=2293836 RepID=A0A371X7I2_9HYPH|nr:tautomerase PptA [Fulvimarina endophytica]RFC65199.1 tautomerase PptA [Fulvimarina endophytica]
MPHVSIKHFPKDLSPEQTRALSDEITAAIQKAFASRDGAISIAVEPVEKERWQSDVYEPEIVGKSGRLIKRPDY